MTVADFLDVFDTVGAKVAIGRETGEKVVDVLTFMNIAGASEQLAPELSGSTVKSIDITGSMSVNVVLEALEPDEP